MPEPLPFSNRLGKKPAVGMVVGAFLAVVGVAIVVAALLASSSVRTLFLVAGGWLVLCGVFIVVRMRVTARR